jgi:beta-phosphoglucomutase-like phosphatase (HAD superfamily)
MVAIKKPAPDVYLYALEKLALPANECLAIEDSHQGLRAATGAGLQTVITVNRYTQDEDFSAAVLVLNHLGEPDLPFEAIAGSTNGASYFDLALAEYLLEAT